MDPRAQTVYEGMKRKGTKELLDIWAANDREQWSEQAFEAVRRVLAERGVEPPPQQVPPAADTGWRTGTGGEPVTIAVFSDPFEAEIARSVLDVEGIATFLADDVVQRTVQPIGGTRTVRLQVAREDGERALATLRAATHPVPVELEAASPPAGRGTEPEAASAPAGRGTELVHGEAVAPRAHEETRPRRRRWWWPW